MKKFKKAALTAASYVSVAALAIGGTVAYLSDSVELRNTLTVGNVKIEQLEYERVVEDEEWVASEYTGYGYTADKMQEFTQGKPAVPAVYKDGAVKWDDRNTSGDGSHQQPWSQIGAPGSNQLFDDSVKNVVDKFVFVKNTGRADAYYRTIIAIEAPENLSEGVIHTNFNANTRFDYGDGFYANIDGTNYLVYTATYNEILTPGEVSRPSLLQLFLDPETTNEDCELFGDTWDIRVISQAIQTDGFDSAAEALEEGFGSVTKDKLNEWFKGKTIDAAPEAGAVRPAGYAPSEKGEIIENLIVTDSSDDTTNLRALYKNGITGDIVVSNSYLDGTYAMNLTADETKNAVLTVEDTALMGWTSYSGFASVNFTNCTFDQNSNPEIYKTIRPYDDTVFTNCNFAAGYEFWLDKLDGATLTFDNCTIGGKKITSIADLNIKQVEASAVESAITIK